MDLQYFRFRSVKLNTCKSNINKQRHYITGYGNIEGRPKTDAGIRTVNSFKDSNISFEGIQIAKIFVRIPPPTDENRLTLVRPVFILFGEDENPFQDVSLDWFEREAAEGGGLTTKCQRH